MENQAKVLVVDDQEPNRVLLNELLEGMGFIGIPVNGGPDVFRVLENEIPDLILLDLMMPIMDGREVLERLMASPVHRRIPVVMVSALDDLETVAHCIELGAVDYLSKPFNLTILEARIRSCIERKKLHDKDAEYQKELEEANRQIQERNTVLKETNVQLEAEIQKRIQIEKELKETQQIALKNAHAAGMSEITGSVLHNVGNTLNSVNISCQLLRKITQKPHMRKLEKANKLLHENLENLASLVSTEKGRRLARFYLSVGELLIREDARLKEELDYTMQRVNTAIEIIRSERNFASGEHFNEPINLKEAIEDFQRIQEINLKEQLITVKNQFTAVPLVQGQKAKLGQVFWNLFLNAKEALKNGIGPKVLSFTLGQDEDRDVFLTITDNGQGIDQEILERIFRQGYTTKQDASGLGLHTCATAMREMGGEITVESPGPGRGTSVTLFFKNVSKIEESRSA